ncbi:hypothetical protein [Ferrimonas marina]|uniref:Uncharacterized protein n=1 Tax=Ferrimonas marina TaxID=299255 RepID=A0A1M5ULG8_9GAMM|nr:hypothetical protein [Ferrimonas marina]SHH63821.1 hypothetical protein SAMN02745129_2626 [Ferrimonas marina]
MTNKTNIIQLTEDFKTLQVVSKRFNNNLLYDSTKEAIEVAERGKRSFPPEAKAVSPTVGLSANLRGGYALPVHNRSDAEKLYNALAEKARFSFDLKDKNGQRVRFYIDEAVFFRNRPKDKFDYEKGRVEFDVAGAILPVSNTSLEDLTLVCHGYFSDIRIDPDLKAIAEKRIREYAQEHTDQLYLVLDDDKYTQFGRSRDLMCATSDFFETLGAYQANIQYCIDALKDAQRETSTHENKVGFVYRNLFNEDRSKRLPDELHDIVAGAAQSHLGIEARDLARAHNHLVRA